jgi:hypothetical protein
MHSNPEVALPKNVAAEIAERFDRLLYAVRCVEDDRPGV